MDVINVIGRVLFALLFLQNGWNHVANPKVMVPFGEYIGVPSPKISVPLTGVMMLVGGITIALGFWADLGAILLVLFLPAAGYYGHAYWKETDPNFRAAQQAQFWKNIALTGAALFIFAIYGEYGDDAPASLGGPLFFN
jgi:putative oxidoreductase